MSIASRSPRRGLVKTGAVVLSTILAIALVTNPRKSAYVDYASQSLVSKFQTVLCGEPDATTAESWLARTTEALQDTCRSAIMGGSAWNDQWMNNWLDRATRRQNYVFFSIYTTEVPGKDFKTIAVFGNFLPLK